MDFSGFVLGLRFPLHNDACCTAEKAWKTVFSSLSAKEAAGLELHQTITQPDDQHTEASLICVLSNMSLSRCRKVYRRLRSNSILCAHLMFHRPFILSNQAELLDDYTFIGRVSSQGIVECGEETYAGKQFIGTLPTRTFLSKRIPTLLLGAKGIKPVVSSEELVRTLISASASVGKPVNCIPFPIEMSASAMLDTIVRCRSGRYTLLKSDTVSEYCAVLPDRTYVVSTDTAEDAAAYFPAIYAKGYRKILLATVESVCAENRQNFIREQESLFPNVRICWMDPTEVYLDCLTRLSSIDIVVFAFESAKEEEKLNAIIAKNLGTTGTKHFCLFYEKAEHDDIISQLCLDANKVFSEML